MFDKLDVLQMAYAMASHAAVRQNAVAQNIANADTPGYRARDVASFAETYESTDDFGLRTTRAGHIGAPAGSMAQIDMIERTDPGTESPNGNTVSLENEMVAAADVQRQHDLALTIYQTSMGILRTSLGRGR